MIEQHQLPFVSILVINYQGERHLHDCLQSLKMQTYPKHLYEVIVVDNNSSDKSVSILKELHPWCKTVALKQNVGFAQGNNIAAQYAHGSWLVLLNNDTIADPYFLIELMDKQSESPSARVAKLVFTNAPTILNSCGAYLLRDGRGTDRGFQQHDQGTYERTEPVFAGCGAAIALRNRGEHRFFFEPSYFVYYEDLRYFWILRQANQSVRYLPRSLVRHTHGAAAGDKSYLFHYYVERNRALTSLRCGDLGMILYTTIVLATKMVRSLLRVRSDPQMALTLTAAFISYLYYAPSQIIRRLRGGSDAPGAAL